MTEGTAAWTLKIMDRNRQSNYNGDTSAEAADVLISEMASEADIIQQSKRQIL
jgi:hypothetical protein